MQDPQTFLYSLRRPRLLVQATRHGAAEYRRDILLRRIFPGDTPPGPGRAFAQLVAREALMEDLRLNREAHYSAPRHIEILIALVEEARLAARLVPQAA